MGSRSNTQPGVLPGDFLPSILSYRGPYGSHIALPFKRELELTGGKNKLPFCFLMYPAFGAGVIDGNGTDYCNIATPDACYITDIVASSSEGEGSFTLQIQDVTREELMQGKPIIFANAAGTAQQPRFLKHPYKMPTNGQIQIEVVNLSPNVNTIQIVAWGLRD